MSMVSVLYFSSLKRIFIGTTTDLSQDGETLFPALTLQDVGDLRMSAQGNPSYS